MMLVISSTKSSYEIAYVNVIYKEGKKTVFYKYIYKIFSYLLTFAPSSWIHLNMLQISIISRPVTLIGKTKVAQHLDCNTENDCESAKCNDHFTRIYSTIN